MNTLHLEPLPLTGTPHLNQSEVACRWRISERTLERWRWRQLGPPYLKVSGHVLYRLGDILAYEKAKLRVPSQKSDPFFQKVR